MYVVDRHARGWVVLIFGILRAGLGNQEVQIPIVALVLSLVMAVSIPIALERDLKELHGPPEGRRGGGDKKKETYLSHAARKGGPVG